MKKVFLILVGALILSSCSSPLDKKYNEETAKEDFKAVTEKVSYEEAQLITAQMVRTAMAEGTLEGKTYGDFLISAQNFQEAQLIAQKESDELAAKTLKEEQERTAKLNKAVIVTCFKKGYTEYDYQDYLTYSFAIENKSDKKIRAIKGMLNFAMLVITRLKRSGVLSSFIEFIIFDHTSRKII